MSTSDRGLSWTKYQRFMQVCWGKIWFLSLFVYTHLEICLLRFFDIINSTSTAVFTCISPLLSNFRKVKLYWEADGPYTYHCWNGRDRLWRVGRKECARVDCRASYWTWLCGMCLTRRSEATEHYDMLPVKSIVWFSRCSRLRFRRWSTRLATSFTYNSLSETLRLSRTLLSSRILAAEEGLACCLLGKH